ncbi:unnamed protein product, partial [Allacma fusca]
IQAQAKGQSDLATCTGTCTTSTSQARITNDFKQSQNLQEQ